MFERTHTNTHTQRTYIYLYKLVLTRKQAHKQQSLAIRADSYCSVNSSSQIFLQNPINPFPSSILLIDSLKANVELTKTTVEYTAVPLFLS